jgi:hypothetical protein
MQLYRGLSRMRPAVANLQRCGVRPVMLLFSVLQDVFGHSARCDGWLLLELLLLRRWYRAAAELPAVLNSGMVTGESAVCVQCVCRSVYGLNLNPPMYMPHAAVGGGPSSCALHNCQLQPGC